MFRQIITRLVVGVALLAASFAWSGWVFLHSVGDPHRAERIAHAILDSPDARSEIAGPITDQLIDSVGVDPATKATIRDTVASVLADPTVIDNFVAAFGSAQANALGVDDPRPTTIDVGALTNAVRQRLVPTQPEIAAQIPTTSQTIDLPTAKTGAVRSLRTLAERWTTILGLVSIALLVLMMFVGHRRTVLRSYGFWAILTGAFWAIGPRLAPWLAHQAAPDADALIRATVTAVAGPITAAATALVVTGMVALVVRYAVLGTEQPRGYPAGYPAVYPVAYPVAYQTVPAPGSPTGYGTAAQPATAAPRFGLTRTDQVPVTAPAYQQPAYQQPAYQQPAYQQPAYQQPAAPSWAQQPPAPPHRSTPIDEVLAGAAPVPGAEPIPLVIRPLDLPSSHQVLFPLSPPEDPHAGS